MNTCEKCGMESPDQSEFCTSCGTRFCAELHAVLVENGLEAYLGVFRRNHILTPDELALLEESNFDELGIAAIGDRTRLRKAIRSLRGLDLVEITPPPSEPVVPPAQISAPPILPPQYAAVAPPAQKSRVVYVLLAVFLGALGIHNFYAGRNGPASIQLLLSVFTCFYLSIVSWIWAVIEAVTVKADGKNVPFK